MYALRRFYGERFSRINAIIDEFETYLTGYVNLIGSATLPFPEVGVALSSPFSICRVEGHVTRRYFPKTDCIDMAEQMAEELLRALFAIGADYGVTLQPHSATQANQIAFVAALEDGDTVLSLAPDHGGHVSHTVGIGRRHRVIHYHLVEGRPDYDELAQLASTHEPRLIIAGGSSYPCGTDFERIATIASSVGALVHADLAHMAPFVMTGLHPPAVPFADFVTIDSGKTMRGPPGGILVFREQFRRRVEYATFPLIQSAPNQNGLFAKLVALQCATNSDFRSYALAMQNNAKLLGQRLRDSGVQVIPEHTESHLLLADVRPLNITGIEAEQRCEVARILVNRNQIPGDTRPPWIASGIRLSSTMLSILHYTTQDIASLGKLIAAVLTGNSSDNNELVRALLYRYHRALSTSSGAKDS